MSAFVCSRAHIEAVADAATRGRDLVAYREVYGALVDANIRSVCHRYPDDDPKVYADLRPLPKSRPAPRPPVQIIKLAHCLGYQSCEIGDYAGSFAEAQIEKVIRWAIYQLPGYEEAPWAID